jgi:hypothetical protein
MIIYANTDDIAKLYILNNDVFIHERFNKFFTQGIKLSLMIIQILKKYYTKPEMLLLIECEIIYLSYW